MDKKIILTIIFFLAAMTGARADTPFDFFLKTSTSPHENSIRIAEKMYNEFSSDESEQIEPIEEASIKNPFLSQLPVEEEPEEAQPSTAVTGTQPVLQPQQAVEEQPPTIAISGLIWNSDKPQAILNNTVVGIGDEINGWKIIEISKEGVLIESLSLTHFRIQP